MPQTRIAVRIRLLILIRPPRVPPLPVRLTLRRALELVGRKVILRIRQEIPHLHQTQMKKKRPQSALPGRPDRPSRRTMTQPNLPIRSPQIIPPSLRIQLSIQRTQRIRLRHRRFRLSLQFLRNQQYPQSRRKPIRLRRNPRTQSLRSIWILMNSNGRLPSMLRSISISTAQRQG